MWIPITLAAATFQILRTSRQHQLRSVLSVNGAGFVRYAYGFPLALLVAIVTFGIVGEPIPSIPPRFWPIIAGAGVAQILGTLALLRAFDLRDFAIGTVYAKTEVILVAVVERDRARRATRSRSVGWRRSSAWPASPGSPPPPGCSTSSATPATPPRSWASSPRPASRSLRSASAVPPRHSMDRPGTARC